VLWWRLSHSTNCSEKQEIASKNKKTDAETSAGFQIRDL
jgi:hypothetical protein